MFVDGCVQEVDFADSEVLAAPCVTGHKAQCFRETMRTHYPGTPHWVKIHSVSRTSADSERNRSAYMAACRLACVTKGYGMEDRPMLVLIQTECGCVLAAVSTCSGWSWSPPVPLPLLMISIVGPHAGVGILEVPSVESGGFGPMLCPKHEVFLWHGRPVSHIFKPQHRICRSTVQLADVVGAGAATFTGTDKLCLDAVEVYVPA